MHIRTPWIVKRKALWNYSEVQARQAWQKLLEVAYAQVPYYRELCGSVQELATAATVLQTEQATRHYFQLFPFSRPLQPEEEVWPETLQQRKELLQALLLTEQYSSFATLFEIREALMDVHNPGPFQLGKRYVLLSDQARTNPFIEQESDRAAIDDRHRLKEMRNYYVLGNCRELKYWLSRLFQSTKEESKPSLPTQLFLRLDCRESKEDSRKNMAEVFEIIDTLALARQTRQLVFEPMLGYIGAYNATCGHYHVNWQKFFVQNSEQGIIYSKIGQKRPTIIHYQASGTLFSHAAICPLHASPILVSACALV